MAEKLPALRFEESGWCEKLKKSYMRGIYQPATREEFEALKGFASGVVGEPTKETKKKPEPTREELVRQALKLNLGTEEELKGYTDDELVEYIAEMGKGA